MSQTTQQSVKSLVEEKSRSAASAMQSRLERSGLDEREMVLAMELSLQLMDAVRDMAKAASALGVNGRSIGRVTEVAAVGLADAIRSIDTDGDFEARLIRARAAEMEQGNTLFSVGKAPEVDAPVSESSDRLVEVGLPHADQYPPEIAADLKSIQSELDRLINNNPDLNAGQKKVVASVFRSVGRAISAAYDLAEASGCKADESHRLVKIAYEMAGYSLNTYGNRINARQPAETNA